MEDTRTLPHKQERMDTFGPVGFELLKIQFENTKRKNCVILVSRYLFEKVNFEAVRAKQSGTVDCVRLYAVCKSK
jgi:hypothetical protein